MRREFHFTGGGSSKFWIVEHKGSRHVVHFGRIGTTGQLQEKEFSSEAEAKKVYEKLVAEKLKKGYVEIGSGSATGAASTPQPTVTKAAKPAEKKPAAAEPNGQAAVTPAPAPAAVATISANLKVERTIGLAESDWYLAAWRRAKPLPKPKPQPFDREACAARIADVTTRSYGHDWSWEDAEIPSTMTPEEAHLWLRAMADAGVRTKPRQMAEAYAKEEFPPITLKEGLELLAKRKSAMVKPELMLPLGNLASAGELAELLITRRASKGKTWASSWSDMDWNEPPEVALGLAKYVMPYLSEADRKTIANTVAGEIAVKNWPADHYSRPSMAFYLAAALGMSDELLPIVQSWKDDFYGDTSWDHTYYHQPQLIVFGLDSAKTVEAEMRRLKLPLNQPVYIRAWLAATEYAGLDYVKDAVLAISNKEECEKLLRELMIVNAPEAALPMLELKLSSKAPKLAGQWLEENAGCAIAGLTAVAEGRGRVADAAMEYLREAKRKGREDLIRQAGVGDRVRREVLEREEKTYETMDEESTPAGLKKALAELKAAKLPSWADPAALPPILVGEQKLSDAQMALVLGAMQKADLTSPPAVFAELRKTADAGSLDALAWKLFELWLAEGAPSKEKWAMGAIGLLGGDASVLKITPMIRNWPGESQHQRAVYGLECLRAIGSDTSLMCLNGIGQKLKFKGLKAKAVEFMEAIAASRNMTRAELEDRIVPDCDLDERGTRLFDFGSRQFRFVLGPEMKPMIKDAEGKVRPDLPAPNSKDDAARATEAVESWKLLKKQVKEVARVQAERLEQAMVTGRRWNAGQFDQLLVKHPLMINLVRLVLWGGYDEVGKLVKTFRVTEDQTLADQKDDQTSLKGVHAVGIVHPLHLDEDTKRAWGEIFGDYEIVPPFAQLGRPVYGLEAGEAKAKEITRFKDQKIPATALVGTLERLAWVRGIPQDAGIFFEHTKPFPSADVTAVVQYEDGVPVGYMEGWEDQRITTCFFVPGLYKPEMYPTHANAIPLGKVDPLVISEVLKDLILMASKAK